VEATELKCLLDAVSEEEPPTLTASVALASGTIHKGSRVKACFCPKRKQWKSIDRKSQLPTKGWCALRCCSTRCSAEESKWKVDLSARLVLLREALETALSLETIDTSPSTMKVFMAPEFLLRGPSDACSREDVLGDPCHSASMLSQLQALVSGPNWLHWQCLFGTILGGSADVEESGEDASESYNMAILLKGGLQTFEEKSRYCHTFLKRHQNGIDFLQRGIDLEARAVASQSASKGKRDSVGLASAESLVSVMKSAMAREEAFEKPHLAGKTLQDDVNENVVSVSGCSWGVEVCLDHSMARLKKELKERPELGPLDVQLVTSCGMDVRKTSVAVRPGGLVLHCDGLHGNGYGAHSSAFVWGDRGPQSAVPVRAAVSAHGENWRDKMNDDRLGTLYSTSFPAEVAGPMLRVYDPVPLPPVYQATG